VLAHTIRRLPVHRLRQIVKNTAALVAFGCWSLSVSAAVSSFARVEPQGNPGGAIDNRQVLGSANFSFSSASAGIGFASAGGAAGPGTLSGQAQVTLDNGNKYMSGALTARAEAFTEEAISVKRLICDPVADFCANLVDLGIDKLRLFTVIRASGGTSSSANSDFNHAQSAAGFDWTLNGALDGSISGGGGKSSTDSGQVQGSMGSRVISYDVRPGTELSLALHMVTFAQASVAGGWIGDVGRDHASANADFSHALQWMGVSSMQAFGADGQEVALPTGSRLELLGSSGHDFWNAAPLVTSAVPEPGSWLMMLSGLGLLAWRRSSCA